MSGPEYSDVDGKVQAKYSVGLDSDADGKSAISVGVVVELDKVEAMDEAAQKLIASDKVPQWLKDLLAKYHV